MSGEPEMRQPRESLSSLLTRLSTDAAEHGLTLGEIFERTGNRGHAIAILMLASPFLLPIPLPGLSVILGAVIAVAAVQMALAKPPRLPQAWANRALPRSRAAALLSGAARVAAVIERIARPRLSVLHESRAASAIAGAAIAFSGALLALPLPPGANAPPALAIVLFSAGALEKDGLLTALGYLALLANIAYFTALAVLGWSGFRLLAG